VLKFPVQVIPRYHNAPPPPGGRAGARGAIITIKKEVFYRADFLGKNSGIFRKNFQIFLDGFLKNSWKIIKIKSIQKKNSAQSGKISRPSWICPFLPTPTQSPKILMISSTSPS
jgi:hypothetical protein